MRLLGKSNDLRTILKVTPFSVVFSFFLPLNEKLQLIRKSIQLVGHKLSLGFYRDVKESRGGNAMVTRGLCQGSFWQSVGKAEMAFSGPNLEGFGLILGT